MNISPLEDSYECSAIKYGGVRHIVFALIMPLFAKQTKKTQNSLSYIQKLG